jgi:lipopolysaccharide/colanic/teichoic acid biosynthesis glycosyltransferase
MHLIGPRAEWDILVNEYKKVIPKYQKRHLVKPGITGLAQVLYPYGRNINDARNKLRYDLKYIESWSFGLELKILWKTVMVVLGRRGV